MHSGVCRTTTIGFRPLNKDTEGGAKHRQAIITVAFLPPPMIDKILNAGLGYVVRPIEVYHGANEKETFSPRPYERTCLRIR